MTDEERNYEREWHLDKKVPIAMIGAILVQAMAFGWVAAGFSFRTEALEKAHEADEKRIDALEKERIPNGERIIRVETKLDGIKETVTEIKNLLRAPPEPRR